MSDGDDLVCLAPAQPEELPVEVVHELVAVPCLQDRDERPAGGVERGNSRTVPGGEQASARAADTVRRSLAETLRHGDRAQLVGQLDDVLLGLRSAARLARSA